MSLKLLITLSLSIQTIQASPLMQQQNFTRVDSDNVTSRFPIPSYDIDCVESSPIAKHFSQVKQVCIAGLHNYLFGLPQSALHWSNDPTLASDSLGVLPIRHAFGESRGISCNVAFLAVENDYGEEVHVDEVMTPDFVFEAGAAAVHTCFDEGMEGMALFGRDEALILVVSGTTNPWEAASGSHPNIGAYR